MVVALSLQRRVLVVRCGRPSPSRECGCPTWNMLDRTQQDLVLAGLMEWARSLHDVELVLLVHGSHVIVHALMALCPGKGCARQVMAELCLWADCARVVLELTPSDQWGSNLERLQSFYVSFGFEANTEPAQPLLLQGELIRYPIRGRAHGHDV